MLLALAGVAALGAGLRATDPTPPVVGAASVDPVLELLPEDVAIAELRPRSGWIALTGTLQALEHTDVSAPRAGVLESALLRPGESVTRGQALARLRSAPVELQLRERRAELAAGEAELRLALGKLEMGRALKEQNLIAPSELSEREAQSEAQRARVEMLRARVAQAQAEADGSEIRAPMSGVIAERLAEPGSAVAAGAPLFRIVDLATLELRALVPAGDVGAIRIGQPLRFRAEGFGEQSFAGRVERISPATEPGSRSIAVYVRVANPEQRLKAGIFAQGTLEVPLGEQAVMVPAAAVQRDGERRFVNRIAEQRIVQQPVELGEGDPRDGSLEIRSGLEAGAQVVVGNHGLQTPGTRVHVAAPQPRAQ